MEYKSPQKALIFFKENQNCFLEPLVQLLSIPSISTSPEHKTSMVQAAEWLCRYFSSLGFTNTKIFPTAVHPIVYAEYLQAGPHRPTLLIYGHYDVQPPEPVALWQTEPFTAAIQDDCLFARGSSDMKGQIIAVTNALQCILQAEGSLPVNIKFLIEGEEEIGSPSLASFLRCQKELLSSDIAVNLDAGMISPEIPSITYGLRGLAYFEIRIDGPKHDLHSGLFGGIVHNPAQVLCDLISGMHDEQGRVTLPGFYTDVRPLTFEERSSISRLPVDEKTFLLQTGAPELWGETGFSLVERIGARPTLEVNGLVSGFTGSGSKTIIPSWSMAKISTRLVPDQDPEKIHQALVSYLQSRAPRTVRWEVMPMAGSRASITDTNHPATKALSSALEKIWGIPPVFKREGGSIPVVLEMQEILGVDSVCSGFGLPDDNIHGPNEKLHLPTWYRGIEALIHFFFGL